MATITDDLDRADSTTVFGADLTWTQVSGTWGTFSNEGYKVSTAGTQQGARAESALASADHYAQVVITALGDGRASLSVDTTPTAWSSISEPPHERPTRSTGSSRLRIERCSAGQDS